MIHENILSEENIVIPMVDIRHIEKQYETIYRTELGCAVCKDTNYEKMYGIVGITDKTKWNFENNCWENAIWIGITDNRAEEILKIWCMYRHKYEHLPDINVR